MNGETLRTDTPGCSDSQEYPFKVLGIAVPGGPLQSTGFETLAEAKERAMVLSRITGTCYQVVKVIGRTQPVVAPVEWVDVSTEGGA